MANLCNNIDDPSIDPDLTCNICRGYLKDPYSTACDHTFCSGCLFERIRSGSCICPRCAKPINSLQIKPASRIIRDMVTRSRVICQICGEKGILKDSFDDHLKRHCGKLEVNCLAADVYCSWKGTRDDIDEHLKTCVYYSLHSLLKSLITENRQLKEQINQYQENHEEKHFHQMKDIENLELKLGNSLRSFYEQLNLDENRLDKHDLEILHMKNQINQLEKQIEKLEEDNRIKTIDQKHLIIQSSQHEKQIEQLTKKFHLLQSMIIYQNALLVQRIELCQNRLMNLIEQKLIDQDMFIVVQQAILQKHSQELYLQSNQITCQGALILAEGLINEKYLERLYLNGNQLGDQGVEYLCQIIATQNFTLKCLDLGSNQITDQGAEYLANMLKTNVTLTNLFLKNNQIGNQGVELIAKVLIYSNKTLEELVFDQNQLINDSISQTLIHLLLQNQTLKTLRISQCNLSILSLTSLKNIVQYKEDFILSE